MNIEHDCVDNVESDHVCLCVHRCVCVRVRERDDSVSGAIIASYYYSSIRRSMVGGLLTSKLIILSLFYLLSFRCIFFSLLSLQSGRFDSFVQRPLCMPLAVWAIEDNQIVRKENDDDEEWNERKL